MIAVSTTCMAEVIGDDLNAFVIGARKEAEGELDNTPIPAAHTPSFVGSHITGYDNMMNAILQELNMVEEGVEVEKDAERINIIPGFEPYLGSLKEVKKIASMISDKKVMIGDHEEPWNTPEGEYKLYAGGTHVSVAKTARGEGTTISLQKYATDATAKMMKGDLKQE